MLWTRILVIAWIGYKLYGAFTDVDRTTISVDGHEVTLERPSPYAKRVGWLRHGAKIGAALSYGVLVLLLWIGGFW